MPLAMMNIGEQCEIKRIGGREDTRKFLEKLGFTAGGIVTVISSTGGSLIVNIKDSRVAIGKDMANRIIV
ncbi:MAG: ferrous iron transport protein A [Lachnospiraceae bacterium]